MLSFAAGGVAKQFLNHNDSKTNNNKNKKKKKDVNAQTLKIVAGTNNQKLADEISDILKIPLVPATISMYSDGEVGVSMNDTIRGGNVFVLQSCGAPVSSSIMELLLCISCARRAGAKRVTAIIPFFPYKHHRRGMPSSQRLNSKFLISPGMDFAKMLEAVGVDRVISVDLQRPGQGQEACFFDNKIPLETIVTTDLIKDAFVEMVKLEGPIVVVSPNEECLIKALKFERRLSQHYPKSNINLLAYVPKGTSSLSVITDNEELTKEMTKVEGANVVIVDDVIDTARTISVLAQRFRDAGARSIHVVASHGIFSGEALQRIDESPIDKVFVTNTLSLPTNISPKVVQISVAPLLARVIWTEHFQVNASDEEFDFEIEDLEKMP